MNKETEETDYKPYIKKVEEIRQEVKKKVELRNKNAGIDLTPEQLRIAEETISLKDHPGFKALREFEALLVVEALRTAFSVKQSVEKTYGESMSYNEGYYHGLLKLKSELDRLWLVYLNNKKIESRG